MRGQNTPQNAMFSYIPLESRVPKKHPLRKIREIVDDVLETMSSSFDEIYSHTGRPSIPPEVLIKALFIQYLYGFKSERVLLEQIDFNLLYRWFVGISADDEMWNETVFSKNRERLLGERIIGELFSRIVNRADEMGLLSSEHFSVDGTLLQSWASMKSFKKKDGSDDNRKNDDNDTDKGNPSVDFHGEKRSNETHESCTDPEARLYKKSAGSAAKLCFMGHALSENRNGLAVRVITTQASYHAEHEAALRMIDTLRNNKKITLGADKHYDNHDFCKEVRERNVIPHVAQNIHSRRKKSAIDGRTTRYSGYEISIRKRKRIEEIFGWLKDTGCMRRPHFRGLKRISAAFTFSMSVYNVIRVQNLMLQPV